MTIVNNFFQLSGVWIFLNLTERSKRRIKSFIGRCNKGVLGNIHREITAVLRHAISFITLSDKGVFYQHNGQSAIIESHLRNIADCVRRRGYRYRSRFIGLCGDQRMYT